MIEQQVLGERACCFFILEGAGLMRWREDPCDRVRDRSDGGRIHAIGSWIEVMERGSMR